MLERECGVFVYGEDSCAGGYGGGHEATDA
jgi:hypothetical protein